ncbi:Phage portal protein, SPP1 Gp6-like [Lactobacillus hominis DSM 23910 = CRBIP 24.179]|nr:Phage portal protein, SPP1 Gp6-like [Lactobacillus hominis DSM 23910 = CRBIP 24.179]
MRYYNNKNDITLRNDGRSVIKEDGKKDDPLRQADNRISNDWHQLLVNQEASYLTTTAPIVDVGSDSDNQKIQKVLGDQFSLVCSKLVVDAANAGVAWLHYWIDDAGNFRYGIIAPDQIVPIYDTTLDTHLIGVLRSYKELDEDSGKYFTVHEYWTAKQGQFFKTQANNQKVIEPYDRIHNYDVTAGFDTGDGNTFNHDFGRVPFIPFPKNMFQQPDLFRYKGLIDAYDHIYNGFLNDVTDVQQVILVLNNYGGTDLDTFMKDLRDYKAIKFNNAGNGDKSGVDKLTIDIPVEARKTLLDLTRENLFTEGQGIDPAKFETTNASGTAIKMLYSNLELKAATTQSYFTNSINDLVRAIMTFLHLSDPDGRKITQTWKRTRVEDSLSQAQTLSAVANYSSKEAIARANPIVDDWQQELQDLKKDAETSDPYAGDDYTLDDEDSNGDSKDKDKDDNKDLDDEK